MLPIRIDLEVSQLKAEIEVLYVSSLVHFEIVLFRIQV